MTFIIPIHEYFSVQVTCIIIVFKYTKSVIYFSETVDSTWHQCRLKIFCKYRKRNTKARHHAASHITPLCPPQVVYVKCSSQWGHSNHLVEPPECFLPCSPRKQARHEHPKSSRLQMEQQQHLHLQVPRQSELGSWAQECTNTGRPWSFGRYYHLDWIPCQRTEPNQKYHSKCKWDQQRQRSLGTIPQTWQHQLHHWEGDQSQCCCLCIINHTMGATAVE